MVDKEISASWTVSVFCWVLGLVLIVAELMGAVASGDLGLWFTAAGATLSIKGFICALWQRLEEREVSAYLMGQDVERARAEDIALAHLPRAPRGAH